MLEPQVPAATGGGPDRRLDIRYVGPVNGCYTLSDRRDGDDEAPKVFACRAQSVSPASVAILAPVKGEAGDRLNARLDGLGIVQGRIERQTRDGFVFQIIASDEQRRQLAARIAWLKKKSVRLSDERRTSRRVQPRDPRSILALPDGTALPCLVIDVSRGGAAVSARVVPPVGTAISLGPLPGRVMRHLEVGFAVRFDEMLPPDGFENCIRPDAAAPR